jgi:protein-disulfide isomerase
MNNQPKNNNLLPLAIIGIVLLVAVVGGWMLYKSSTATTNTANKTNTSKSPAKSVNSDSAAQQLYATAPPGAQPPHMLGSPAATVTVEEFADFQCPTCAQKHPLAKEIISAYGNRIKFVFRQIPLVQAHPKAYDAAVASEAAGLQGKFWDMQNQLFLNQQSWSTAPDHRKLFEEYAQKIGLDLQKFQDDMAGMNAKGRVDADIQRARTLRVQSTPTFLINGVSVAFAQLNINSMRQLIDAELQKTQSVSSSSATQNQTGATNNSNTAANK